MSKVLVSDIVNHFGLMFQVAFNLSDALANKEDKDNTNKDDKDNTNKDGKQSVKVPREYKMVLSKVEQSMGVFSEGPAGYSSE